MAEPLTDDQLRKLISLSRKASAKPWLAQDEEEKPGMCFVMCQDYWLAESIEPNDAAYIVAACNAGEALADEVLRLRAALERYRHCRHACIDCSCTKEARAAMNLRVE